MQLQTRLQTPEEFGKSVEVQQDGSQVLLRDVAGVELGAEDYFTVARYNESCCWDCHQTGYRSNAPYLAGSQRGAQPLISLFPRKSEDGLSLRHHAVYQTSIQEVFKTLVEAIILVFLVMYLFLQNFRAESSRRLPYRWLFSDVCEFLAGGRFHHQHVNYVRDGAGAIGLLADDAIVVVETVQRVIAEDKATTEGEATHKSMGQIDVRWSVLLSCS
ncbi:efflux RND transporter permease subunit [Shigella flexneri]